MNILEIGIEQGKEQGLEEGIKKGKEQGLEEGIKKGKEQGLEEGIKQGIKALIETCQELGMLKEEIIPRLMKKFSLPEDAAEEYLGKYWQNSI